jgi:hypothetical protein
LSIIVQQEITSLEAEGPSEANLLQARLVVFPRLTQQVKQTERRCHNLRRINEREKITQVQQESSCCWLYFYDYRREVQQAQGILFGVEVLR